MLEVRKDDRATLTFDLLNPKSIGFDIVSSTTTVANFKPHRSGNFVLSCIYTNPHAHTHRDKVIAVSAPPYYVVGADRPISHFSEESTSLIQLDLAALNYIN